MELKTKHCPHTYPSRAPGHPDGVRLGDGAPREHARRLPVVGKRLVQNEARAELPARAIAQRNARVRMSRCPQEPLPAGAAGRRPRSAFLQGKHGAWITAEGNTALGRAPPEERRMHACMHGMMSEAVGRKSKAAARP